MPERQPCSRSSQGCKGTAFEGYQECLEHLSSENLDQVLGEFSRGASLDAGGIRIKGVLLHRILAEAPTANGRRQLDNICFNGARFTGQARFDDAQFGNVLFVGSQFERDARFQRARFGRDVRFSGARFVGQAQFDDVVFQGDVFFRATRFAKDARFQRTCFDGDARFDRAWFVGQARFDDVVFQGDVFFRATRFAKDARFQRARFRGDGHFDEATAEGVVRLGDAVFLGDVWGAQGPFATAPQVGRKVRGGQEVEGPSGVQPPVAPPKKAEPQGSPGSRTSGHDGSLLDQVGDFISKRLPSVGAAGGKPDETVAPERPVSKPADLAGSTEAMRQSTRWIAGAFAGIGVVLVAGLQLGRLGQFKLGDWHLHGALLAMAVALFCVGRVIWLGSKVLAARYSHVEEMQGRRVWIDLLRDVPAAAPTDARDLKTLLDRREEYLKQLKNDDLPSDERLKLADELGHLNQLADDALTIENFHSTWVSYRRFVKRSRRYAFIIVAAIAMFAWVSTATIASHPTLVQIRLTAKGQSENASVLGQECVDELIPAVVTSPASLFDKLVSSFYRGSAGPKVLAVPPNCRGQPSELELTTALATMDASPRGIPSNALLKPRRAESFLLFNPSRANTTRAEQMAFGYGRAGDTPLVGHWNGARRDTCRISGHTDTVGVYRRGIFYLRNSNRPGGADLVVNYGRPGDTPLVGDWDRNGTDTVGVQRGNVFYLRNRNDSGPPDLVVRFGDPGDTPLVGDWDGNGTDTIGVRQGNVFSLVNHLPNRGRVDPDVKFSYGKRTDTPVAGDWGGDCTDTVGVRRGGVFYLRSSNPDPTKHVKRVYHDLAPFPYGYSGDKVLVGDWDGDGVDEIGVQHGLLLCSAKDCGFQYWNINIEEQEEKAGAVLRAFRRREAA